VSASLEVRLRAHVERLARDIGERHIWRPEALRAAAGYIREELAAQGYEVRSQAYTTEGVTCENLEVTILGESRASEIVLLGAHYDTVIGSPGANDNGSGIAGIIEIARALRGSRPERTVRLVAFVNEEPPFFHLGEMGSMVYAEAARARGDDIRIMLSLEMLGYYAYAPGTQRYPPLLKYFYPDRGDFIAFVSNLRSRRALREVVRAFESHSSFSAESLASPAFVPGVSWSDQVSFWRVGYPGVMVTDTAFYRYPFYHTAFDTPDRLRFAEMARVVDGLTHTVEMLAGAASS
jgi:Zn-dependent M28 family amino/carboxypeptidase